jgi:nitrite reductase (NO-forming)
MEGTASNQTSTFAPWRLTGIGLLRILFGVVWGIDAWFKWQPSFIDGLVGYLTGALDGQPAWIRSYIHFWHHVVGVDPRLFAYLVAIGETVIAVALILGVFTNLTSVVGIFLSTAIWTTAEGFGGPYQAGSTDIGAAIMYGVIFIGLFLSRSGLFLGVDRRLTPALGKWGFLASGEFTNPFKAAETSSKRPQAGPVGPVAVH